MYHRAIYAIVTYIISRKNSYNLYEIRHPYIFEVRDRIILQYDQISVIGQVRRLTFVGVNFSAKFKYFGHIHSVILNRSSEYSLTQRPLNIYV